MSHRRFSWLACLAVPLVAALISADAPAAGLAKEPAQKKAAAKKKRAGAAVASKANTQANKPAATVRMPAKSESMYGTHHVTPDEIDALIDTELNARGIQPTPTIDDEAFLRRVTLDLTGTLPKPDDVTAFIADQDSDKRAKLIDRLLASPEFARNFARLWRDVILYRAQDQRVRLGRQAFEDWLTGQIEKNRHWDQLVTEFLTATGPVDENGATMLFMAQMAQAVEMAGETARIFMGIQIQCAQCHDHPHDQWKREQFHQLAAFFQRARVQRVPGEAKRTFQVVSFDRRGGGNKMNRGPEYFMPDKEDPAKQGTLVHPQFLGEKRPVGEELSDMQRRTALAAYVTNPRNEWFGKAFVNRVWFELMGQGFYEPVDDLGPGKNVNFSTVLNRVAAAFRSSHYDIKGLYRTIANTQAYQRQTKPRDPSATQPTFAANCPTQLRADQVFEALVAALGMPAGDRGDGRPGRGGPTGGRALFQLLFGFDPSTPPDDVQGTIQQALFLMNSPRIDTLINTRPTSPLGEIYWNSSDDPAALEKLYLRVLARKPTQAELATCGDYLKQVQDKEEAFEDVLWCLINSAEFQTKR